MSYEVMSVPRDKQNEARMPPPPPARSPSSATLPPNFNGSSIAGRPPPPAPGTAPATAKLACKRPGCSGDECEHRYEDIVPSSFLQSAKHPESGDSHFYEKLMFDEDNNGHDVLLRLRLVEKTQQEILKAVRTLQETLDKMKFQSMETSDHLGQQILHVRRDILALSKNQPSSFRGLNSSSSQLTRHLHNFEWEVPNVENLAKTQRKSSSQSYMIGQVDFKLIAEAACTKEGRMRIRIFGQFTHPSDEVKSGRFECVAQVVDRARNQTDWKIGKVVGDFCKDKEWMVGDVSILEMKKRGYCTPGGNVHLRFDIEIFT